MPLEINVQNVTAILTGWMVPTVSATSKTAKRPQLMVRKLTQPVDTVMTFTVFPCTKKFTAIARNVF